MSFTVKGTHGVSDEVYKDFSSYRDDCEHMIIVMFDGDTELYSLDPGVGTVRAMSEVHRMYVDGYSRPPTSITVFHRVTRVEFKGKT